MIMTSPGHIGGAATCPGDRPGALTGPRIAQSLKNYSVSSNIAMIVFTRIVAGAGRR